MIVCKMFSRSFMSLLTAKFVKNSHTRAKISFIFLENVLKQTSNILNNQFQAL